MAIQGNVEVLKKDDGSYIFPVTVTEAIKDSGTDKTLKQVMSEFEASVDSQLAQIVAGQNRLEDDTTQKEYTLGINNGLLYYKEVI